LGGAFSFHRRCIGPTGSIDLTETLWVKSRHEPFKPRCPLYSRKRAFLAAVPMSALGQKATSADVQAMSDVTPISDIGWCAADVRSVPKRTSANSFNHLVGAAGQVSGTAMPSALAVFKLMYSSTLVRCCTGNSAGFSPLRMHYSQRLHRRANRPNTCLHRLTLRT